MLDSRQGIDQSFIYRGPLSHKGKTQVTVREVSHPRSVHPLITEVVARSPDGGDDRQQGYR